LEGRLATPALFSLQLLDDLLLVIDPPGAAEFDEVVIQQRSNLGCRGPHGRLEEALLQFAKQACL